MDETHGKSAPNPFDRDATEESHRRAPAEQARQVVGEASSRVRDVAESRKAQAADRALGTAEALHQAARTLEERDQASIARYVEQLAGTISRFSTDLRDKNAGEFLEDARDLARRNPALFIGGAFAAGVFLGRFARSSARHGEQEESHDEYAATDRGQQASPGEFRDDTFRVHEAPARSPDWIDDRGMPPVGEDPAL